MRTAINTMISKLIDNCLPWIKSVDEQLMFVDPIDDVEISAHYGATHMAAALIIYGLEHSKNDLENIGVKLLDSIMNRWEKNKVLPGFHNDFNNFALCVIENYIKQENKYAELNQRIKEIVLSTSDSNNPTINWMPMRWYVNQVRYAWTGEEKYKTACEKCRRDIETATYEDGFVDDRLPIGVSFNLQYDVATVAGMQFLKSLGISVNIDVELGALINAVAPDGDINYLGRGTNQVFAWGLWIYLLASAGKQSELEVAEEYLGSRLDSMLIHHNLMLNDYPGEEKYLWWDYHYCSVYTAHLLLWLVLAEKDYKKYPLEEKIISTGKSGLSIYRTENCFAAIFKGKSEYLAEKGPVVAALWTKSCGMIMKGAFGPWSGHFGDKYTQMDAVIRNYLGLYSIEESRDLSKNRIIRKLKPAMNIRYSEKVTPIFSECKIKETEKEIVLSWTKKGCYIFNFPVSVSATLDKSISLSVDGIYTPLIDGMMIKNQYGWMRIFQSHRRQGTRWELLVPR